MILDIDRLPREGLNISREFEFSSEEIIEENAVFLQPVHAEISVKKAGDEIFIKGRITTSLSFVCSRCLIPFEFPVNSHFDLVYLPEELEEPKEELESDDMNISFYYSRQIDLKDVVLEQLNLTFPLSPYALKNARESVPYAEKTLTAESVLV